MTAGDAQHRLGSGSSRSGWITANATVFVAAACVMAVEILATRLVARYLGSSLYTWTSAIGVVLTGISAGNYFGGRLADRWEARRTLALLFIAASIACMTIPMVNAWLGGVSALDALSWPTHVAVHFALTFLLPSFLLGTMSPVVAKRALDMGLPPGRTIGTIYAWGAIGSIVGTFASGFWLIAWVGTERSILTISGVLAVVGILYGRRALLPIAWGGGYGALLVGLAGPWSWSDALASALGLDDPAAGRILFERDSRYQRVLVLDEGGGRRTLQLDAMCHSLVDLNDPLELRYDYEGVYAEVLRAAIPGNAPVNAMLIGGGGFVFPRYLELSRPGSAIEVSEIDPVVRQAAHEAFGLPRDTTIRSFELDGRNRVADLLRAKRAGEAAPAFDLVFCDAFKGFSVPFHLTTVEFDRAVHELLDADGVYAINLIDILESARFLGATVCTLREVFAHVQVLGVSARPDAQSTFVVVGSKRPLDLSGVSAAALSEHGVSCELLSPAQVDQAVARAGGRVLTDDHAPVASLLTEVFLRHERSFAERDATPPELAALFREGRLEEVIGRVGEMLERDPRMPRAHFWLGTALARQARFAEAVEAFRRELELDPSYAPARQSLARALQLAGRPEELLDELRAAVAGNPSDVQLRSELAGLLAAGGDTAAAIGHYEAALALAPGRTDLLRDLGIATFRAGRPDQAAARFREALVGAPDDAVLHDLLGSVLAAVGDLGGALPHFERAVELDGSSAAYRARFGLSLEETGRHVEAAQRYRESLELDEGNVQVLQGIVRVLATSPDPAARDGAQALRWAEQLRARVGDDRPEVHDTLAAALAEAGRFPAAVAAARRALLLAEEGGRDDLVELLRERIVLYEAGRPLRSSR